MTVLVSKNHERGGIKQWHEGLNVKWLPKTHVLGVLTSWTDSCTAGLVTEWVLRGWSPDGGRELLGAWLGREHPGPGPGLALWLSCFLAAMW